MRLRFARAVTVASLGGGIAICTLTLTPWGDPCTAQGYAGHACPIILSASQLHLRDAVLGAILLFVGFVAGTITASWRYIAGGLSTLSAAILAGVCGHFIYRVDTPLFPVIRRANYFLAVAILASLLFVGVLGATASRWLPNFRSSERAGRVRRFSERVDDGISISFGSLGAAACRSTGTLGDNGHWNIHGDTAYARFALTMGW
jgi:hypothetical protein